MTCHHCGATIDNGLALCELCQRKARTILEFLPIYFRNLARWRPGRAGSRPVPGSRVLYMGEQDRDSTGDRISDRLDDASTVLGTWAEDLAESRPYLTRLLERLANARAAGTIDEAEAVAWLCKGFDRHLTSVATLDWCGDFVTELDEHEAVLRRLTEESVPGWYAGGCQRCDSGTYVVPGLTWVTCGGCGVTTYARDHLDIVLNEARGWIAAPMRIAEAIVALVDTEISVPRLHKRISKWGERDQITVIRRTDDDGDVIGPKRYRLGEVLDAIAKNGSTRVQSEDLRAS